MTFYEALVLFRDQVKRKTGLKVVVAPSPIKESGPYVKIAVRKPRRQKTPVTMGASSIDEASLRLSVSVGAVVESETGLKQALDASETLQVFLEDAKRLENEEGKPIAGSGISSSSDENDSILEDPESGAKAWVDDLYYVDIEIP